MVATSKPYLLLSPTIFIIIITYICVRSFPIATDELGFSVELIHKDSPKSPFYDNSTTPSQKLYSALHHSMNPATRFLSKTKSLDDDDNPESSLKYANAEYVMGYSLGTPSFQTYGVVDTGSDLTWLLCTPCFECYNQTIPMFDLYASSSTYRNYNCHSNECESVRAEVDDTYCDVVSNCAFKMNFVAESSGIVGLGRGRFSLISQMGSSIQRKFSYCLTPFFSSASSQLHFGRNAVVSGSGTVSTRLVSRDPYRYYFVNLEAMSVEIP
ncbi:hypothetical protein K1719_034874 [Acacia pycnantha]|nr:hypothetical protein K1719_034874 [Acacia pycnantha]